MLLVKPEAYIIQCPDNILERLENAGRVCYKSEDKITDTSARKFVKAILTRKHESVLEHVSVTVRVICDRGVSHEIVRHRIASYSQESTRYVNYNKKGCTFVIPPWCKIEPGECSVLHPRVHMLHGDELAWLQAMIEADRTYNYLVSTGGWTPQQARSVLPNSTKTEIVMTMNLRSWRNFFKLRTAPDAHPQMREIAVPLLEQFCKRVPVVFEDVLVME